MRLTSSPLGLAAFALVFAVAVYLLGPWGASSITPSGERSLGGSSFEEGIKGSSSFYRLVRRVRSRTGRWLRPLTSLPPGGTLVVFAPSAQLGNEEQQQLLFHIEAGGTVLLVSDELPDAFAARGLELWQVALPAASRPLVPSALVDPAAPLESRGMALARPSPELLPLYGSEHGARVAVAGASRGQLVLVTDPFILSNEGIRRDGNLRFAWRLANALPEPIWFDEFHHGFEARRGLLAYARQRGFGPALSLGLLLAALALWRARASAEPLSPPAPARPLGPVAHVEPLAARLHALGAREKCVGWLGAEARRRGIPRPAEGGQVPPETQPEDPERRLLLQARLLNATMNRRGALRAGLLRGDGVGHGAVQGHSPPEQELA